MGVGRTIDRFEMEGWEITKAVEGFEGNLCPAVGHKRLNK